MGKSERVVYHKSAQKSSGGTVRQENLNALFNTKVRTNRLAEPARRFVQTFVLDMRSAFPASPSRQTILQTFEYDQIGSGHLFAQASGIASRSRQIGFQEVR